MQLPICQMFGLDLPIFAFSHCRDVVASASRSGGMGILGAAGFSPEQLEWELNWLDEHTGGKPYGVDVLVPNKAANLTNSSVPDFDAVLPQANRQWVEGVLQKHNVPALKEGERDAVRQRFMQEFLLTREEAEYRLEVAFRHPKIKLMVSALGVFPPHIVERAHRAGIKVGSLVGKPEHAKKQVAAGADIIIAQGTEAGGHTGEISTLVLVPEVVDLVGSVPVLAAGGIGRGRQMAAALALGAQGVWCGTIWLGSVESDVSEELKQKLYESSSSNTVRTRCNTGKPARRLRTEWVDAWAAPDAPAPLQMPLQSLLVCEALDRIERFKAKPLMTTAAGQIVGSMKGPATVRQIIQEMAQEMLESTEKVNQALGIADPASLEADPAT